MIAIPIVPFPNPIFCAAALTLCCCNRAVADDEECEEVACMPSVLACGSEAEGGKVKVADVEVDVVAGATMAVVGVDGDVPVVADAEPIGPSPGDRLDAAPGAVPSKLFILLPESLAPCFCLALYGKLTTSPPVFVYDSCLVCDGWVELEDAASVFVVSDVELGRCRDELDAPSSGWVRVSLGCRGTFAARPSDNEENSPFGLGSSADDILDTGMGGDLPRRGG